MAKATVYTTMACGYCARALKLLRSKGVEIEELEAGFDAKLRAEMVARSGGRNSFPQVFIGERHVGGSTDLAAMEADGRLDEILAEAG